MEISVLERTWAIGKWLMHASDKTVTELHKAALSEAARNLDDRISPSRLSKPNLFDVEAVAIKVEAELWKRRHATTPIA
jgi:hypothetical protein